MCCANVLRSADDLQRVTEQKEFSILFLRFFFIDLTHQKGRSLDEETRSAGISRASSSMYARLCQSSTRPNCDEWHLAWLF